jgi:hypothetical protein
MSCVIMCVYMYVHICLCICIYKQVRMLISKSEMRSDVLCVYMYVHICMCVCVYIYIYKQLRILISKSEMRSDVLCYSMCVYVCTCIYIYIYIYINNFVFLSARVKCDFLRVTTYVCKYCLSMSENTRTHAHIHTQSTYIHTGDHTGRLSMRNNPINRLRRQQ